MLRIITAALGFIWLVLTRHPTPGSILAIGTVALIGLGLIEFFGREPSNGPIATTPPAPARPAGTT
jgi:hypothetical protein